MKFQSKYANSIAIFIAATATSAAHAELYNLSILSPPVGYDSYVNGAWPYAINNNGTVVGYSVDEGGRAFQATIWNDAAGTPLGTAAQRPSYATAINDLGQVVGNSSLGATVWNGGTASTLSPNGYSAWGINNSGQIVGNSIGGPTVWTNGSTTNLPNPSGFISSNARSINNSGQVAGTSTSATGNSVATVWTSTVPSTLAPLSGYTSSSATAINNIGQVAGVSISQTGAGDQTSIATLWNTETPIGLNPLVGYNQSDVRAMNSTGWVVGSSYDTASPYAQQATLWQNATAINLNTLLSPTAAGMGWILWNATAINDNGWIVGSAVRADFTSSAAFLLTPVPEPGIYTMLLGGLGVTLLSNRRKKFIQIP